MNTANIKRNPCSAHAQRILASTLAAGVGRQDRQRGLRALTQNITVPSPIVNLRLLPSLPDADETRARPFAIFSRR